MKVNKHYFVNVILLLNLFLLTGCKKKLVEFFPRLIFFNSFDRLFVI